MINITDFNTICTEITTAFPAIKHLVVVAHEGHAQKKLGDKPGICMVAVIPSGNREGRQGSGIDRNATWIFIMEKDIQGQTNAQEIAQYQRLQTVMLQVRDWIEEKHDDGDPRFYRYVPSEVTIDPEYSEFGGRNGWGMSFVF